MNILRKIVSLSIAVLSVVSMNAGESPDVRPGTIESAVSQVKVGDEVKTINTPLVQVPSVEKDSKGKSKVERLVGFLEKHVVAIGVSAVFAFVLYHMFVLKPANEKLTRMSNEYCGQGEKVVNLLSGLNSKLDKLNKLP